MSTTSASWVSVHGVHLLTILGPAVAMAMLALGADARAWLRRHERPVPCGALLAAAALSCTAAAVHVIVCPEHYREHTLYGVFFTVAAASQLGWAAWLLVSKGRRWLVGLGLAGNVAMVALWAVSRTVGLPLGPEAGSVESIGKLDIIATTAEVGLVAVCVWMLVRRPQRPRRPVDLLSCRLASASSSSFSPSASVRRIIKNS
jgi:hypothetical protein